MSAPHVLIRIGGEGGEGIISTGDLLSRAASRQGLCIMTYRTYPAEIKGGLAQFQMKLASDPIRSIGLRFQHLMAFNQEALDAFHDGMLKGGTIYYDPAECPDLSKVSGEIERVPIPLTDLAKEKGGSIRGKNMVALGFLSRLASVDLETVAGLVREKFKRKGEKVLDSNLASLNAGYDLGDQTIDGRGVKLTPKGQRGQSIVISGNEATMLGALAAGCKYMAGYPITPASSILEFATRHLPRFGGTVVQAEDEISAMASCIGASFVGKKAMTATSGPGLMLKGELITLASTQELPVVIIDVQRGGPSTGLPTKQEQSDLKFAIYGTAGEAPKIVVAPATVEDCFYLTAKAFSLAEEYQMPVIVLSDTNLAVRTETVPEFDVSRVDVAERLRPTPEQMKDYKRYEDTPTGVSPIIDPGTPGGLHIAPGLEHDEYGTPCYTGVNHTRMNAKRFRKLETLSKRAEEWMADWAPVEGAELCIIGWGSTKGAIQEACQMAAERGIRVSHFHPRIVAPLPEAQIREALSKVKKVIVVEENFTGQFSHFLKAKFKFDPVEVLRSMGVPITPDEVLEEIVKVHETLHPAKPQGASYAHR